MVDRSKAEIMDDKLTIEVMADALRWINGEESSLDTEQVKEIVNRLGKEFRRAYLRRYPDGHAPWLHPVILSRLPSITDIAGEEVARSLEQSRKRLEDMKRKTDSMKMDSVMLINAISHVAKVAGEGITESRAQMILYCVYGSHLAHTGERLDIEHPQAWKYGPVFPTAYNKGKLDDEALCCESYENLSNENPQLASLVWNKTSAMLRTPMVDLNICHKGKSSPYARTLASKSAKWGTQIDDSLIKTFFQKANQ